MYYSQAGQDEWVLNIFNYKNNGVFIDAGAYDGVRMSNTYLLEKNYGWTGICIEAEESLYQSLIKSRSSECINVAISNYNGHCFFQGDSISDSGTLVKCLTLDSILTQSNIKGDIDYLSIDIEGHEYPVLENFPFDKWKIGAITIEHNKYLHGEEIKNKLYKLLISNGFIRIREDATVQNSGPVGAEFEDWYIHPSYKGIKV
jgi:FkbM family methyltransferase